MPGIYLHIPFCDGKCPYCDFYSQAGSEPQKDHYTRCLSERVFAFSRELTGSVPISWQTVYFGGGTPNLLGAGRLASLLSAVRKSFPLEEDAEITAEANPTQVGEVFFADLRKAGFNRLSMGLQSANEDELRLLGRKHSARDAAEAVRAARAAGFANLSLDLMLGLPGQTREKLGASISFAAGLGVPHISSYILKIEEGTPFSRAGLSLPEDDEIADLYLFCVEELARHGYAQYEISNFARPGWESRHNLLYWHGEEYLGFGPGAHSFFGGRRFYWPRSLQGFLDGEPPVDDGPGGGFEEYAMLALRLTEGLTRKACENRFPQGGALFDCVLKNIKKCPQGLLHADIDRIALTPEGFLVSNALILTLLENVS